MAPQSRDPSESADAADETRDIAIVRVAPSDLPEHSLVSYNPDRTRFERPVTPGGTTRASRTPSEVEAAEQDLIETHFPKGPRTSEPPPPRVVSQEDRHRLMRLIGRGGCGEVWEAIQVQLDRPVAVKRLRQDRFVSTDREESREEMIRYFREEALIAARLDHPNIVPVYDYSRNEAGDPELSMKLVRGRPWDKLLKTDRQEMKFEDLLPRHLQILADVANSVAFAHSRSIVHRDIKPSQVMVGDYGEVLLMDWGLALVFGAESGPGTDEHLRIDLSALPTLSTASSPAGTPAYMAPEQTLDSAQFIGPWTDVYLLGGCLYCILVGTGPYGDSPSHEAFLRASEAIVRDPREVMPDLDIPDELAELALWALRREPRDRVESAAAFVKKLEDWISGASRRRESEKISDDIAAEIERPRTRYSEFVGILNRIQEAAGLWPGNPALPELRIRTLIEYGELALTKGDLLLAQTEAELLAPSAERDGLLQRVEAARIQRQRVRRQLRIAAVLVSLLVTVVVAGGLISYRAIKSSLEESLRQTDRATDALGQAEVARADAERAREKALNDQIYAQVRYATSLVDAGRHDMARLVLWSIPEASRSWEWAYLISRANQPLAEFPFKTTAASSRGNWLYVDDGDGIVEVRDTMAGALVAKLDHQTTNVLVLTPQKDTHVDTIDGGSRLTRWSPPDWKPQTLAEFPSPVVIATRVFGGDDFLVGFQDKSAAVLDGESGLERLRLPPIQDEFVAIDSYPPGDIIAVAGTYELALYSFSTGSLLRQAEMEFPIKNVGIIDFGKKVLVQDEKRPHIYDLQAGTLIEIVKFAGLDGLVASHPEAEAFFRSPDFLRVDNGEVAGEFPVSSGNKARVKFTDPMYALFWGGDSGEAGFFGFAASRLIAKLRGLDSPIVNMWAVDTNRLKTMDEADIERIFTTTENGKTQVWLGGQDKYIARLRGQWGSFRDDASVGVSIGGGEAIVQRLDRAVPPYIVGSFFRLYRSIAINETRGKIYTFGLPQHVGYKFGWEVYDIPSRSALKLVAASDTPYDLPYKWCASFDDSKVVIMWSQNGGADIWSADEGVIVARIEPTGSATTSIFCTPWETLYAADIDGKIREYSLKDGALLRTTDLGTAIWMMKFDRKNGRLLVSGNDNIWRLYSISRDGLDQLLSRPTNAGPVVLADFGAGGTSILAETLDDTIIVTEVPSGTESLRLKVDTELTRISLNKEGTRIFGIGDDGLYVWDTLGREVARVPGVRDIGLSGRRLLISPDKYLHSRDLAIELPPYRIDELPGNPDETFEERYRLYRQNEYRSWFLASTAAKIPWSLPVLADTVRGTVSESGAPAMNQLYSLFYDFGPSYPETGNTGIPLLQVYARLVTSTPNYDLKPFGDSIFHNYRFASLREPITTEIVAGVAPHALLHSAELILERLNNDSPHSAQQIVSSINILSRFGYPAEAKALARHFVARSHATRLRLRPDYLESMLPLLDSPVPYPPDELLQPSGAEGSRSKWVMTELEKLAALDLNEEERAIEREKILDRERELRREWVESVAPRPDMEPLIAELRAKLPPPLPPDMLLSDLFGDTLETFERDLLGGKLLPEALAEVGAKYDASVAAVKAERAAK